MPTSAASYTSVRPPFADLRIELTGFTLSSALPTAAVLSRLESDGVALVADFPTDNNYALLEIARSLGTPVTTGARLDGHPLEDDVVFRVESRNGGLGVSDETGLTIFSTTAAPFDCHTDGYHNREQIDFVLLLCIRADAAGGFTTLAHIDDILDRLDTQERRLLGEPVFPSAQGVIPIISGAEGRPEIRFNLAEIRRFAARSDGSFTAAHLRAAVQLDKLAGEACARWRFVLQPGELLVLDNRRVLHGRSAIAPDGGRLLKRVWVRNVRD